MNDTLVKTTTRIRPQEQSPKPVPVEPGFWILIFGDLAVFAAMFVAVMWRRFESHDTHDVFVASSQQLNSTLGLINTLVLLTSSYFVARGLIYFRMSQLRLVRLSLASAITCGVAFIIIKALEYAEKVAQGVTVTSNRFYEFYFTFTGVHLLHVVIGTGLLCYLLFAMSQRHLQNPPGSSWFEGVACYWHMVDLLWLMLFALFYMIG